MEQNDKQDVNQLASDFKEAKSAFMKFQEALLSIPGFIKGLAGKISSNTTNKSGTVPLSHTDGETVKTEESRVGSVVSNVKAQVQSAGERVGKNISNFVPKNSDMADPGQVVDQQVQPGNMQPAQNKSKAFGIKIAIVILLIMAGLVSLVVFRSMPPSGSRNGAGLNGTEGEIPTPFTDGSFRPSKYADDPEILQIEEDLSVLEREINRAILRDNTINPPSLDFNIQF
jgi:hypothetical protein